MPARRTLPVTHHNHSHLLLPPSPLPLSSSPPPSTRACSAPPGRTERRSSPSRRTYDKDGRTRPLRTRVLHVANTTHDRFTHAQTQIQRCQRIVEQLQQQRKHLRLNAPMHPHFFTVRSTENHHPIDRRQVYITLCVQRSLFKRGQNGGKEWI